MHLIGREVPGTGAFTEDVGTSEQVPTIPEVSLDGETFPKSENPKDIAARGKCPLQLIPPSAETQTAWAMQHGNSKYGPWNWREKKIELMNYVGAMRRHLNRLADGEDVDSESGMAHLAHVAATAFILMDATAHDCVIDDRPKGKA